LEDLLAFLDDVEASAKELAISAMELATSPKEPSTSVKELAACQRQLEFSAQEVLNSGEQPTPPSCVPLTADLTQDSPSEGHLDSTADLKDEARKVITKIQELRKVQGEENPVLAANVLSRLNTLDSLCDRKEPMSDYLQIGAYSRSMHDVSKELTGSQTSCDSAIDDLVRLADTLEIKLRIAEEKGKDEVLQTQVTCHHKGPRKRHVSENKAPSISQFQGEGHREEHISEINIHATSEVQTEDHRKQPLSKNESSAVSEYQTEGPRTQSENEKTAVPQGCIKRLSTVKERTFRVSEKDADASKRNANSATVSKLVEELHNLCELLQLLCENAIATQPSVSTSFLTGADAYAFHSKQCTHLAQASFLNVTFSTQLLAAMTNLIEIFIAFNAKETEARELLSAVRLLTTTLPMLQSKFQRLFSDYMFSATRPTSPESVAIWAGYKAGGTEWRTNAICKQLDTAEEVSVEAASKLIEALSEYDKSQSTSDSDFEEVDVAGAFLVIAKKIKSISKNVMSLTHAMNV
jgi:hypothetical protein